MSATAVKSAPKTKKQPKPSNALKTPAPRKTYIEVMRIIAAFLVIVNHTNSDVFLKSTPSFTWFFSLTYFFISKIAVPVFFMIMGGLLLQKIDTPKRSVQRVVRMVAVTIVFSLVYYIKANWDYPENMSVGEFFKKIFTFRTANAYWYIYAYIGLLILLPILQRMANAFSKRTTEYFIILSMGVMGIIPLITLFFDITPHHYLTDMFFAPHLGIVFAGYYIEKYLKLSKKVFFIACATFVALISFQVVWSYIFYLENPNDYLQLDNWQYLTITASAACFYIIFKYLSTVIKTKERTSKVLCYLGSLTFGIYLVSDLIISLTRPMYNDLQLDTPIVLATILWEIIIFILCGFIAAILKSIPFVKKYI
ncbi:MAG: acyltransferase [Eubacteriales bacterium]|nr:acyltransferase [Eubacteriales bacterium]